MQNLIATTISSTASARPTRPSGAQVPAVVRAVALLDCLAHERAPMSLARLASGLRLPKSSVHALCGTLLAHGYLRRQVDGSFYIGPRVMPLADAFVAGTQVATEFNALFDGALAAPEETVVLSVLDERDVVYVAAHNGLRPLGLAFRVGMRLPAYLAASGKAMLAWQAPEAVRRLYAGTNLPASLGRQRPTQSFDAFEAELARIRAGDCSIDSEGVCEGVHGFGAPVFDAGGGAVAGVAVCVQQTVIDPATRQAHGATVNRVARRLTERLGGRYPPAPESAASDRGQPTSAA